MRWVRLVKAVSHDLSRELERHVRELPLLPAVVSNLMALDRNDDAYFENIVKHVGSDPNFSTRLLSAANSADSAPRSPVTTLSAAVSRIGALSATNVILAVGVTEMFVPRDPCEKSLWRHALQVAILSRGIALKVHHADLIPEEVYTCALLHDLGRFVMFRFAPEELHSTDEGDWKNPEALIAKELAVCGLTHPEIGALACEQWQLPSTIVDVVRDHHKSASVLGSLRVGRLTALIRFADLAMFPSAMPGTSGLASADEEAIEAIVIDAMPTFLRLSAAQLRKLLIDSEAEADRICHVIGID